MIQYKKIYTWFLFIFLGTGAWGTSFFWIKIALLELSAPEVVAWRLTIGAIMVWGIALIKQVPIPFNRILLTQSFIIAILMMIIPMTLITWSEEYIPSSVAGLLNSLTPLMTIVIALLSPSHRHHVSRNCIIGMSVSFVGVLLIFSPAFSAGFLSGSLIPQVSVLIATIGYALGTLYQRHIQISNPLSVACYSLSFGAIALWIITFLTLGNSIRIPSLQNTWIALLWMGMIGSGFATLIYMRLIQTLGPTKTASVSYLLPLSAYILGIMFLGETVTVIESLGGGFILIGIYLSRKSKEA